MASQETLAALAQQRQALEASNYPKSHLPRVRRYGCQAAAGLRLHAVKGYTRQ